MCTTTSHWETHISTECSTGGNGQCDGFCVDHSQECTCFCHKSYTVLPETVEEVLIEHDQFNDVVDSYEYGTETEQWEAAQRAADRLNDKPVDGRLFVVQKGQDRTVVVERY